MEKSELTRLIKQKALGLEFDDCGVARAEALGVEECYVNNWLGNGYHAGMEYMAKNLEKRLDHTKLMEGAKSIICLLANYKPEQWQFDDVPQIASFAYGRDYHVVLKERLWLLQTFISSHIKASMRLFVDTAPVLERAWAVRA